MIKRFLTAAALFFTVHQSADAQLVECNGLWTNKPCEEKGASTLPESNYKTTPPEPVQSKKQYLLHELTMASINAKNEHDVIVDVEPTKTSCMRVETSLDSCRESIQAVRDKIDERVNQVRLIKLKEQEIEQKKKESEKEASPAVVVIREERRRRYPRYPHEYVDEHGNRHGGSYQGTKESSSFGISGSFSNADGSVSVGGTTSQKTTITETVTEIQPVVPQPIKRKPRGGSLRVQ